MLFASPCPCRDAAQGAQITDYASQNSKNLEEFLAGLRFEHKDKLEELLIDC